MSKEQEENVVEFGRLRFLIDELLRGLSAAKRQGFIEIENSMDLPPPLGPLKIVSKIMLPKGWT